MLVDQTISLELEGTVIYALKPVAVSVEEIVMLALNETMVLVVVIVRRQAMLLVASAMVDSAVETLNRFCHSKSKFVLCR